MTCELTEPNEENVEPILHDDDNTAVDYEDHVVLETCEISKQQMEQGLEIITETNSLHDNIQEESVSLEDDTPEDCDMEDIGEFLEEVSSPTCESQLPDEGRNTNPPRKSTIGTRSATQIKKKPNESSKNGM